MGNNDFRRVLVLVAALFEVGNVAVAVPSEAALADLDC